MNIKFVNKKTVIFLQKRLIEEYGGKYGLRDEGLLDSALAQAQMTMDGEYLHKDIFDMAAAYGYHLCQNHAFIDGNKRIALVLMAAFLQVNGWELIADEKSMFITMLELASGNLNKEKLAKFLRNNSIEE